MKTKLSRKRFLLLGLTALLGLVAAAFARFFFRQLPSRLDVAEDNVEKSVRTETDAEPKTPARPKHNGVRERAEEDPAEKRPKDPWKRVLGSTGETVSLFGLGGAGIIARAEKEEEALALLKRALDRGVNYIDTAPSYAGGVSERHIGRALKHRRREVFLATKTLDRTYEGTLRNIESSLERLQTDYLDLYQIHGIRDKNEADRVLEPDGAVRALQRLREEGVVKYTGATGHRDPQALRYLLERHEFDCVLIPLNPADLYRASFQKNLLPFAVERKMGIITMKVVSYGRLLRQDGIATMKEALGYVCTLPIHTAIVGLSSLDELEENIAICQNFSPLSPEEMDRLESLAEAYQEEANFYKDW